MGFFESGNEWSENAKERKTRSFGGFLHTLSDFMCGICLYLFDSFRFYDIFRHFVFPLFLLDITSNLCEYFIGDV